MFIYHTRFGKAKKVCTLEQAILFMRDNDIPGGLYLCPGNAIYL